MDLDFISEHFPRLLKATKLTIELTSLSLFFGIFVGVFFAILRTSKNKKEIIKKEKNFNHIGGKWISHVK